MMKLIQNIDVYVMPHSIWGKKTYLQSMIRLLRLKMLVLYPQTDFFLRQE